jgi:hypothetical protein
MDQKHWMSEFHFADGDDINTEARELARVLGDYWNAICDLIPNAFGDRNDYVIQKTPGVFALHMLLAKPVLRDMYQARRPYTKDDFKIMLEPIAELSESKAHRRAAGEHLRIDARLLGAGAGPPGLADVARPPQTEPGAVGVGRCSIPCLTPWLPRTTREPWTSLLS